jgi:hypothetical protein
MTLSLLSYLIWRHVWTACKTLPCHTMSHRRK